MAESKSVVADSKEISLGDEVTITRALEHASFSGLTTELLIFTQGPEFGILPFVIGKQKIKLFGCPLQMIRCSNFMATPAQTSDFFKRDEPHHLASDIEIDEDRLVALLHTWLALNFLVSKPASGLNINQILFLFEWCNYFDLNTKLDTVTYSFSAGSELSQMLLRGNGAEELKKLTPLGNAALIKRFEHEMQLFIDFKITSQYYLLQGIVGVPDNEDVRVTRQIMREVGGGYRFDRYDGKWNQRLIAKAKCETLHPQEVKYLKGVFNIRLMMIERASKSKGRDDFHYEVMHVKLEVLEAEQIAEAFEMELPPYVLEVQAYIAGLD